MSRRVIVLPRAQRQILRALRWWALNRDKAPDGLEEDWAEALASIRTQANSRAGSDGESCGGSSSSDRATTSSIASTRTATSTSSSSGTPLAGLPSAERGASNAPTNAKAHRFALISRKAGALH